jgi:hypothetical protein
LTYPKVCVILKTFQRVGAAKRERNGNKKSPMPLHSKGDDQMVNINIVDLLMLVAVVIFDVWTMCQKKK